MAIRIKHRAGPVPAGCRVRLRPRPACACERQARGGRLEVRPDDFQGSSMGSRFYPLLSMLSRVHGAQDLGNGNALKEGTLGKLSSLQVHHIFPKALLYKHGYNRAEVNAVAYFCFLTQDTNLRISAKRPEDCLPVITQKVPGALESQWIPADPELWRIDAYRSFLAARRQLLAEASNMFLTKLLKGPSPVGLAAPAHATVLRSTAAPVTAAATDEDVPGLAQLLEDLRQQGFAEPELDSEVTNLAPRGPRPRGHRVLAPGPAGGSGRPRGPGPGNHPGRAGCPGGK
ncbi:hypothetical protein [Streptomyces sp. NPDC003393]